MMDMAGMEPPEMPKQASTAAREAYFVDLAKALMTGRTPPLLVTGGFRTERAMESALADGIAMIGIGRPLCATPDAVAELLDGHIDELPRPEQVLRIGPGPLGPNSPIKIIRSMNGFSAQAWYYAQLRHIAAGRPAQMGLNPFSAFLSEQKEAKARL
jgi:hypothetical protein